MDRPLPPYGPQPVQLPPPLYCRMLPSRRLASDMGSDDHAIIYVSDKRFDLVYIGLVRARGEHVRRHSGEPRAFGERKY